MLIPGFLRGNEGGRERKEECMRRGLASHTFKFWDAILSVDARGNGECLVVIKVPVRGVGGH